MIIIQNSNIAFRVRFKLEKALHICFHILNTFYLMHIMQNNQNPDGFKSESGIFKGLFLLL